MTLKRIAAYAMLHIIVTVMLWMLCLSLALGYGFDSSTSAAEYIAVYAAYIVTAILSPLPWLVGVMDFAALESANEWLMAGLFVLNSLIYGVLLNFLHKWAGNRKRH